MASERFAVGLRGQNQISLQLVCSLLTQAGLLSNYSHFLSIGSNRFPSGTVSELFEVGLRGQNPICLQLVCAPLKQTDLLSKYSHFLSKIYLFPTKKV